MPLISVCKQVIAQNNKAKWIDPKPAIRVSNTRCGKVTQRAHKLAIHDAEGNVVATVLSTTDGNPVISCGAKVAIDTVHPTTIIE